MMQDVFGSAALVNEPAALPTGGWATDRERPRANILGVGVDAVDTEGALARISQHLEGTAKGYVCAVGVHGILEALASEALASTFAHSILNVPDGAPTVWIGRLQGFRTIDHVTGPALMRSIVSRREFSSRSHFLYGGKPGVAEELAIAMRRLSPGIKLAGTYTPPFRELTCDEEEELIAQINAVRPDFIWVGINTPRQDLWMRRMLPRLDTRVMFGVGAAFDFLTGRIRECPDWVKRGGFHWLHRLMQEPRRLWRRNAGNTAFLLHIALQGTGLRAYPLRSATRARSDHAL
jgi:N-acetylglucosaminyldiphosphoundecaprenol N-acetyl-beta-D-mannosaminyltransferase